MASLVSGQGPITVLDLNSGETLPPTVKVADGYRYVYVEESPLPLMDEGKITAFAYLLQDNTTKAKNLPEIIESGRIVALKFEKGVLLGALFHPKFQFADNISRFVLNFNEYGRPYLLKRDLRIVKSTEEQYKTISSNLLKTSQGHKKSETTKNEQNDFCTIS